MTVPERGWMTLLADLEEFVQRWVTRVEAESDLFLERARTSGRVNETTTFLAIAIFGAGSLGRGSSSRT